MLSSINSINNNCQKQQNFGATPGIELKSSLKFVLRNTTMPQDLVTFFREEKELAAQLPPKDFASRFKAIKAIGKNGQEIDPTVEITANISTGLQQENMRVEFDVSLPFDITRPENKVAKMNITKKMGEPPKTFLDRFLLMIQQAAESLQDPKDVVKASNIGFDNFFKQF